MRDQCAVLHKYFSLSHISPCQAIPIKQRRSSYCHSAKTRHPVVIFVASSQSIGHRLSPPSDFVSLFSLQKSQEQTSCGHFRCKQPIYRSPVIAKSRRVHCHQSQSYPTMSFYEVSYYSWDLWVSPICIKPEFGYRQQPAYTLPSISILTKRWKNSTSKQKKNRKTAYPIIPFTFFIQPTREARGPEGPAR